MTLHLPPYAKLSKRIWVQSGLFKFDQMGNGHVLQSIQYGPVVTSRLDKKSLRDAEREQTKLTGGR